MANSAITGPVLSDVKRSPAGTAAAPSWSFVDSTGTGAYLVSPDVFGVSTAGLQRMVVDASGNVGIGGAATTKFTVNGISTNYLSGAQFAVGEGTFAAGKQLLLGYNTTNNKGFIQSVNWGNNSTDLVLQANGGNLYVTWSSGGAAFPSGIVKAYGYNTNAGVGSGSLSNNVFNINWTGSVAQLWIDSSNLGTISTSSDYRIKKNIETQEQPALERIAQLRPVKYELADYKELFNADGVQREGFIAHELQEVIPSAVEGEKDAESQIQSLKLDALCSVMVKAIQEQQEIISKLEARIATLESK
jgi:hypothetical protein